MIPYGVRDLGSYRARYKCDTILRQRPGFIPVRHKCDTIWRQRPGFIPGNYSIYIYIYHVASEWGSVLYLGVPTIYYV